MNRVTVAVGLLSLCIGLAAGWCLHPVLNRPPAATAEEEEAIRKLEVDLGLWMMEAERDGHHVEAERFQKLALQSGLASMQRLRQKRQQIDRLAP